MISLTTQTTNDQPQVLLIAEDGFLFKKVNQFLQQHDLGVIVVKPQDLYATENLEEIQNFDFYKTIFIYGESEYEKPIYQRIIGFLKEKNESKIIITKISTKIESKVKVFKQWQELNKQEEEFLSLVNEELPESLFLIGKDLVLEDKNIEYPLKFFVLGIDKQMILDPQTSFNFQSGESFFNTFKLQLLKPHQVKKYLIKGALKDSKTTVEFIKFLYQRYFNKKIKIVKLFVEKQDFSLFETVDCSTSDNVESVIDQKIRNFPLLLANLPKIDLDFDQESKQQATSSSYPASVVEPLAGVSKELEINLEQKEDQSVQQQPIRQEKVVKTPIFKEEKKEDKLDKELKKIFKQKRLKTKFKRTVKKANVAKKITKKLKRKKLMFYGGLIFSVFGCSTIIFLIVLYLAGLSVKKTFVKQLNLEGDIKLALQEQKEAWGYKFISDYGTKFKFLNDLEAYQDGAEYVTLINDLSNLENKSELLKESKKDFYASLLDKGSLDPKVALSSSQNIEKELYEKISLFEAKLKDLNLALFSPQEQELIEQYLKELRESKRKIAASQQFSSISADFFGLETKKTYALIVQDNQELRPTGGFIQAVILLTFDKGILIDQQVFSSQEVDSRVLADVAPPSEITSILGEDKWYFRDTNWDPDFKNSSKIISWYLKEAFSKEVDGVIAINYLTIRELIADLGAIEIPAYNEIITDKNLFERIEFHIQDGAENNNKEDYSKTLLTHLINKIQNSFTEELLLAADTVYESLDQKQAFIHLNNADNQMIINNLGWSGDLIKPNCPAIFSQDSCFVDTFYQVEANVGINKVNDYIKRSISHNIEIFPEYFNHKRIITFNNNARMVSWPQGTYKSYLRFYLPEEAKIKELKMDDLLLPNNQYSVYQDKERQVVGILLEVKVKESVKLEINYQVDNKNTLPYSYLFFDQKQAGIENTKQQIFVVHSSGTRPSVISPQAEVDGKLITFEGDPNEHNFVGVSFE